MWEYFYLNIELVDENAKIPTRAQPGDAGCDVYSPIDFIIPAQKDYLLPLGWRCEMPRGYAMIMKEKSGVATKKKLSLGACVVDADYRGIVHAHLFNHSNEDVSFSKGDKVAQFVIFPIWDGQPEQVESVNLQTDRGTGGFGSTGK